jgi:hypothetical protein
LGKQQNTALLASCTGPRSIDLGHSRLVAPISRWASSVISVMALAASL